VEGATLRAATDEEMGTRGHRRVELIGLRRRARASFQNAMGRFRLG
jgi:hypothetical protein